ncbi:uncharacterized protein LOC113549032 [Rhopalosiphum maidis]|uniref:uncharacterized protein LOC113549032 n=1 Tax=Rhopalosiphum maidis TaxID=43146 RepID=UPI000EFDD8FE|nr:uncharacterized protein LOC113549032 [Rhopalosiphum maidis]XP_060852711.1 uncharacterized protein LOC132930711 [Rhopalosiphum padi]
MNSLVADYGDETDTDSLDSDQHLDENTKDLKTVDEFKSENKLPAPKFKETGIISESVFRNPYLEAERAKSAVLEKHVKMVPAKDHLTKVNGKNICWMNKKGRCRFGNKCKFAHDSELFNGPNIIDEDKSNKESFKLNNKKKRPGLSQTLIPGKKILKIFKKTEMSNIHS